MKAVGFLCLCVVAFAHTVIAEEIIPPPPPKDEPTSGEVKGVSVNETEEELPLLPPGKCVPGKTYKDDCNTCTCGEDGVSKSCTLMACIKQEYVGVGEEPPQLPPGRCVPGKLYKDDCNTCICGADGKPGVCTARACPKDQPTSVEVEDDLPQLTHETCIPGQYYKQGCNTCLCDVDGIGGFCSMLPCPPKDQPTSVEVEDDLPQLTHETCIPGQYYKQDCNTCFCGVVGRGFCTAMACPPNDQPTSGSDEVEEELPLLPPGKCVPGKAYKDDCNTCICGANGIASTCTRMACRPKFEPFPVPTKFPPVLEDSTCQLGKSFKKGCNTCFCFAPGKIICTALACNFNKSPKVKLPPLPEDGTCKPGKSYKKDCNTCRCMSNGKLACTMKACFTTPGPFKYDLTPLPEDGTCQPGKSYKKDCNICYCFDNGETRCTIKDCPSRTKRSPYPQQCRNGDVRNQDCNVCRCAGGVWACTRRFCRNRRAVEECQPGDTKEIDCNECTCHKKADGGSAWACTRKLCPDGPRVRRDVGVTSDLKNTPCAPNDFFQLDCNTCYCNSAKTGYLCTENICSPDNSTEAGSAGGESSTMQANVTYETTTVANLPLNTTENSSSMATTEVSSTTSDTASGSAEVNTNATQKQHLEASDTVG